MEIEASPQVVAKKLWNMLRLVLIVLRKGIAKSKVMAEFHLLVKRGKLAAGKAIAIANTLTLHHHYAAAFACRRSSTNNNNLSFLSPHDYEFSCSNSPAINHHRHHHRHRHGRFSKQWSQYDDVSTVSGVQKVLEMLNYNNNNNNNDMVVEGNYYNSPLVALPGFGKSPIGKQLRITDSPFPLKEEEGDDGGQVDVAAEEFIKRFYKNLNLQHMNMAATESPYNYYGCVWKQLED